MAVITMNELRRQQQVIGDQAGLLRAAVTGGTNRKLFVKT